MQHGAGEIEDRRADWAGRLRRHGDEWLTAGLSSSGSGRPCLQPFAGSGQFGTDAAGDELAAVRFDQFGKLLQDAVDRGS